jgi:hypothetical protein
MKERKKVRLSNIWIDAISTCENKEDKGIKKEEEEKEKESWTIFEGD